MIRSSRQKINEKIEDLENIIDQIHITDIYRTFSFTTVKYTFFQSVLGTFSRRNHIVGHKTHLRKFKKIKIIPSIFSDHNGMLLEINKRKTRKFKNTWKSNKTLLNNQWSKEEIKGEVKYHEIKENENTTYQNLWDIAKGVLRWKFRAINAYNKKQRDKLLR